jgi:hypothetical protein
MTLRLVRHQEIGQTVLSKPDSAPTFQVADNSLSSPVFTRNAQWRPCRIHSKPIESAGEWDDEVRATMEQHLDQLEAYLEEIQRPRAAQNHEETPNVMEPYHGPTRTFCDHAHADRPACTGL